MNPFWFDITHGCRFARLGSKLVVQVVCTVLFPFHHSSAQTNHWIKCKRGGGTYVSKYCARKQTMADRPPGHHFYQMWRLQLPEMSRRWLEFRSTGILCSVEHGLECTKPPPIQEIMQMEFITPRKYQLGARAKEKFRKFQYVVGLNLLCRHTSLRLYLYATVISSMQFLNWQQQLI